MLDPRHTAIRLKRFKNELNFERRVRHDNIVSVVDSGVMEIDGNEVPFFVMPFYPKSLRKLLNEGDDAKRLLRLYDGVLAGMQSAHEQGIWHRDLKPENILYDLDTDRLIIADFGIAHFEEDLLHTAVETRDAERLANFQYAAPEQRTRGGAVDHRSDIYAAGLILNELFTRTVPHGTGYRRVRDVDRSQSHVDEIVEKMIRFEPRERHASMDDVRKDLDLMSVGPALAALRKAGAKVSAADTKKLLFHSTDGVELATREVAVAYRHASAVLDQAHRDAPSLKLEFEQTDKELVMRTRRTSARVNWYYAFSNSLENARVTISTYKGLFPLPSERRPYGSSTKPVEMSKNAFRPDYIAERGFCWLDESGKHITSRELGDRLVSHLIELDDQHETSDEEIPMR
jgi:serine/threonine protein kinase